MSDLMAAPKTAQVPKETELDRKTDAVFKAARKSMSAIRYAGLVSPVEGTGGEGAFHALIDHVNSYCTNSEKNRIRENLKRAGHLGVADLIKNR